MSLSKGVTGSVSVEVEGCAQPLAQLIINLGWTGEGDQMDYSTLRSWQRPSDPSIAHFVREIDAEQYRPYARPEFGDLAVTLEEDPDVDRILVDRPETAQVLDDKAIDLFDPARMSSQQVVDCDTRYADMRLVGRREFAFTVRAHPTRHVADCSPAEPLRTRRTVSCEELGES